MITTLLTALICTASPVGHSAAAMATTLSPEPAPPPSPTNALADRDDAAALGQALFFDATLSRRADISCATCHDPAQAFTDGRTRAVGTAEGTFNSPTVLGAAHHRWLFWDGRADSLWSQALGPMENPREMDGARVDIVRYVSESPHLRAAIASLDHELPAMEDAARFPPGARPGTPQWDAMSGADRAAVTSSFVVLGKAIAAYERRLRHGVSPFDRWVASITSGARDDALLPADALRGYALFAGEAGCTQCHFGPLLTDLEFHDLALAPEDPARPPTGRAGGYEALRSSDFRQDGPWSDAPASRAARRAASARVGAEHWGAFRTPSLRNVAVTPPYMHDGRFASLEEVLSFYNTLDGQVRRHHHAEDVLKPLEFTDAQLADLEAFLESLTGAPPDPRLLQIPPIPGIQPAISDE